MSPTTPPLRLRGSARRHVPVLRWAVAAVAVAVALAGCGLRVETPAPTAPSPDAREVVRSRGVGDALELASGARAAAPAASAEVQAVLSRVADFSDQHALALGGVYDSGLAGPSPSPSPTAAVTTAAPDAGQVLALLATGDRTAAADAAGVADRGLARLLASIAAARAGLVAQLAAALGTPVPDVGALPAAGSTAAPADVGPTGAPTPAAPTLPAAAADVPAADRTGIVAAEDQAGYGYEVLAAKLDDPTRAAARSAATVHRARAESWAQAWGLDGTTTDPRRATYALPIGLDDPATALALAQGLEAGLATTYASAVGDSAPAGRGELVTAFLTASADASAWGAPATAFPGLPERVG